MQRSWLVQRLGKPRGNDNPFSFGGGLKNGGLSKEAMELLRPVFSFDYMGAAEFEFGAVPEAFQRILNVAQTGELVGFSFEIPLAKVEKNWRDKSETKPKGNGIIFVLCHVDDQEEVKEKIYGWATDPYGKTNTLKEVTRLSNALRPFDKWDSDTKGWLELDNGFMFFVDEVMWRQTGDVFGLEFIDNSEE